jgi:hypothetical protein
MASDLRKAGRDVLISDRELEWRGGKTGIKYSRILKILASRKKNRR